MSNLAYKIDFEEESKLIRNNKNEHEKAHKNKVKEKIKLDLIVLVVSIVSLGLLTVNNFQKVSALQSEIESIKRENYAIQKEIDEKEAKLEEIRSGKRIEEDASNILGMIYPEEIDKIYINSQEGNLVVEEKSNKNNTILGALFR